MEMNRQLNQSGMKQAGIDAMLYRMKSLQPYTGIDTVLYRMMSIQPYTGIAVLTYCIIAVLTCCRTVVWINRCISAKKQGNNAVNNSLSNDSQQIINNYLLN
jgi:hypothetical protein